MTSSIQHTQLANGIDVLTDQAPHFEAVAISVSFRVGAIHEPEDKAGISHLLEHMMFRGSVNRSGDEIQNAIAELGGEINACTDEDSTSYTAQVVKDDLAVALDILSDMVLHPRLDETDLSLEKQIIERENCRGCYNCSMREGFYDLSYPDSPLQNPIIGHPETLESITCDDLVEYHAGRYVGANLIITVAGDVAHEDVVRAAETAFGALKQGKAAGYPRFDFTADQMHIGHSGDTATLRLGFDFSHLDRKERRAARTYLDILGGHGQSLLMQELREKRGLVYGVAAWDYSVSGNEIALVDVNGEVKKIREVVDVMAQTMQDAACNLSPDLAERNLRRLRNNMRMYRDDLSARVEQVLDCMAYKGHVLDRAALEKSYLEITAGDIMAAGQALLASDPTILTSGSTRHAPKFDVVRKLLKGTAGLDAAVIAAQ